MKRTLLLIPCLGLSAFGGYYQHWNTAYTTRLENIARDPLISYNYRDGRAEAEADLASGKKRLLTYGNQPAEAAEYRDVLERVYRVRHESVTADPTLEVKRYVAAYNAVMERSIMATFGPNTLAEAQAMARRRHGLNQRIANYVPPL